MRVRGNETRKGEEPVKGELMIDHLFLYMEKCNLNVSEIHTEVFKVIKSLFSHKPEHKNISVLVIL